MLNTIKQFVQDESGLETVEWAIVGGIVVAVGAAIFVTPGTDVAAGLQSLQDQTAPLILLALLVEPGGSRLRG